MRALQSLTGGPTIEAAWAPVDTDDGEFSFSLPMAASVRATYVAVPVVPVFTADTAATGRYTVEAAIAGAVKARTIEVATPVGGDSVRPKPRRSGATTQRSKPSAAASASTTNCNDAPTFIQPCTVTSDGGA